MASESFETEDFVKVAVVFGLFLISFGVARVIIAALDQIIPWIAFGVMLYGVYEFLSQIPFGRIYILLFAVAVSAVTVLVFDPIIKVLAMLLVSWIIWWFLVKFVYPDISDAVEEYVRGMFGASSE